MSDKPKTVKELLSSPDKWTQNAFARDAYAVSLNACNPDAVCWCLSGAILTTYEDEDIEEVWCKLTEVIRRRSGHRDVVGFNDSHQTTFKEIRAVIEEANI